MLWLERGDQLPAVAWLQNALNQDPALESKLTVDGDYGKATYDCVKSFQKRHGLPVDGVAGPKTSDEILNLTNDQIVNFVDDSDVTMNRDSFGKCAMQCIMKLGGDIIVSIPNQDGRELILSGLARRKAVGKLALLRIYSHGKPADQNLTSGIGGYWGQQGGRWDFRQMKFVGGKKVPVRFGNDDGKALANDNMDEAIMFMSQLAKYFAPLGSLELHGCNTAKGGTGQSFVARLALAGNFPVTGAVPKTYTSASQPRMTLRVQGPTYTFYPMGMDLKTWARTKGDVSALAG